MDDATMPKMNTITPTHRLLMKRPVFAVYPYTHGEMKVQAPRMKLRTLTPRVLSGLEVRIAANSTIKAPTIQLFQAFGIMYAR